MNMIARQLPLTACGRGIAIHDRAFTDIEPADLVALLDQYLWIVFRGHPLTETEVEQVLSAHGPLTENNRRQGKVLNIDGSGKDRGEVLLGDGYLPLHRDGALMGTRVKYVGIYCREYRNVSEGGRTFISSSADALEQVPATDLDILRAKGVEGKPVDQYYLKTADHWHPLSGFHDVGSESYLNIGFPAPAGEQPSWLVRVPGLSKADNDRLFATLHDALMDPRYCYQHQWQEGDLVLFDNRKTLHGREAFRGQRSLANIQVLEQDA